MQAIALAHADLFLAKNAETPVRQPISEWIVAHQ
jgi:hypothetical protein